MVSVNNSLAALNPDLVAQWHSTKNRDLSPDRIVAGSTEKVWWTCSEGPDHQWDAEVRSRTQGGTGCPFCAGRKVSITNSVASLHPDVADEWHPNKNGGLTPNQVVAGSHTKVWWECPRGSDHEWQASVVKRTRQRRGCPFCVGQRVSITNSLASLHPDLAREWHQTRNGGLTPDQVIAGSGKKHWWKCPKGPDHEWDASINGRTGVGRGKSCPFCVGQRVSVTNSLASLYPRIAKEWHPTKNGSLTPDQVVAGSGKTYSWKCAEGIDHEWRSTLDNRTRGGKGCPFCAGQRVSVTNSVASRHPDTAREWHPTKNGNLTPDLIVAGTHTKAWWKCTNGPDHEWEASVKSRTNMGTGCPCCRGLKASVTNSLPSKYPDVAQEWHSTKNGKVVPDEVVAGSNKTYWWKCPRGPDHEWKASAASRTRLGSGCPFCFLLMAPRSKEEITLAFELLPFFEFDISKHQLQIAGRAYDVDILIPMHRLIIEFDGAYWHREKEEADRGKTERLEAAGWRVIRVRQEPLKRLGLHDVVVSTKLHLKEVVNQTLLRIEEVCQIKLDDLQAYLGINTLRNQKLANDHISKFLNDKGRPL